jgi:hypothetical protein
VLAERAGFEPAVGCPTHAFQACSFGHSDTSPLKGSKYYYNSFPICKHDFEKMTVFLLINANIGLEGPGEDSFPVVPAEFFQLSCVEAPG